MKRDIRRSGQRRPPAKCETGVPSCSIKNPRSLHEEPLFGGKHRTHDRRSRLNLHNRSLRSDLDRKKWIRHEPDPISHVGRIKKFDTNQIQIRSGHTRMRRGLGLVRLGLVWFRSVRFVFLSRSVRSGPSGPVVRTRTFAVGEYLARSPSFEGNSAATVIVLGFNIPSNPSERRRLATRRHQSRQTPHPPQAPT